MTGRLMGKTVLVTGTAGGQGRAAAILFAREGATVFGCDLPDKAAEQDETTRLATADGARFEGAIADMTDPVAARDWVEHCATAAGGINALYNNAALERFAPFAQMSADDFRFALRHEIEVVFHPTQAAWPHLIESGRGAVLCTASASGMRASERIGAIGHAAGKGAVIAMVRQLALEGAPHGIRVNSLSPGPIDTPVTKMGLDADPDFRLTYEGWPMLRTTGRPEDVAQLALFLLSDESRFITGANVPIDGGWTAKGGLTAKSGNTERLQSIVGQPA
jgi:meso-butanediol dehydrogenase / (S,S)-butanediol dehydrogenase / diacetyl reductase